VKLLRQHKQEEAERLILSTPMGDTHLYSDQSKMLFEVRAYKSQDLTLYRSLKALGGGVVEEESALSKALKLTNAPSNVSRAHKIVTQEHPCFKSFARIKEQLREVFELSRIEKDSINARKAVLQGGGSGGGSGAGAWPGLEGGSGKGNLSGSSKSKREGGVGGEGRGSELQKLTVALASLGAIAKLSRRVYQYYHQYVLQIVTLFGADSTYRADFCDDDAYLLALVALLASGQAGPILPCEKPAISDLSTAALYMPPVGVVSSKHKGYLPLYRDGATFIKAMPANHSPGAEYAVNCLHRLLTGRLMM
ncbi:hypothetical protein B484DRAFT_428617, partial [Ochromonadaceae sp. CCMP2298]